MAENFFNVFREVWIEDRGFADFFFVCFGQRDAFGDAATHRLGGTKDCHGSLAVLDDDFRTPHRTRAIKPVAFLLADLGVTKTYDRTDRLL